MLHILNSRCSGIVSAKQKLLICQNRTNEASDVLHMIWDLQTTLDWIIIPLNLPLICHCTPWFLWIREKNNEITWGHLRQKSDSICDAMLKTINTNISYHTSASGIRQKYSASASHIQRGRMPSWIWDIFAVFPLGRRRAIFAVFPLSLFSWSQSLPLH